MQDPQKVGRDVTENIRRGVIFGEGEGNILGKKGRYKDIYALRCGQGLMKDKSLMLPVLRIPTDAGEIICYS